MVFPEMTFPMRNYTFTNHATLRYITKKGKLSVIWPFDQTKRGSDKKITDTHTIYNRLACFKNAKSLKSHAPEG